MGKGMVSAVCIDWPKKEILLVLNTDKEKPQGFWPSGLWGLPGGKIKQEETVEAAVIRELSRETNQEGRVTKYRIEIPRISRENPNEKYIHYIIFVRIISPKELKNHEDPEAIPRSIPFEVIFPGKVKMFPFHVIVLRMLLEKMAEEKREKMSKKKFDRNGIPILSESFRGLPEILDELKNSFDARGRYIIPFYRRRS